MDAWSCVITGSKASCRATFLADSRAFVCVSTRVCVKTIVDCGASGFACVCMKTIVDCGASGFARVFVLCRVACSYVAFQLKS